MEVVRVLLTESQIEAEATNFKERNPLHILANFATDAAVAIFDLFLECMSNYSLDKTDADGNTGMFSNIIDINIEKCHATSISFHGYSDQMKDVMSEKIWGRL